MTREEAKEIFINRGSIKINGVECFDPNAWRDACVVITDWLKKEPCEDVVSRQAAIEAMKKLEQEDIEAYGCSIPEGFDGERASEAIRLLASVQPKAKTGWIPVSERLPKENERCLCSYKDEEGECIDFGLFKDGAWYVKGVVAWMPLPEPYKAESEE